MQLSEINRRAEKNPREFVIECEAEYHKKVTDTAHRIAEHVDTCPVVLVSGPSGSGKTTTTYKLEHELEMLGIRTHTVSLDNYFKTVDIETAPRRENGEIDYESPFCLDLPLLNEHIEAIVRGELIYTPRFNFEEQRRANATEPLHRKKNEIVIIEGIHALNDLVTKAAGTHGIKIYVSARSNIYSGDDICFKGTWVRLIRRVVRDDRFRGTRADFTLGIWDTIRAGEKKFISPFKDRADIIINSTHPYEINMLKKHILPLLSDIPEGIARYDEICEIAPAISKFCDLDDEFVPHDSLLREFIGGGNFNY